MFCGEVVVTHVCVCGERATASAIIVYEQVGVRRSLVCGARGGGGCIKSEPPNEYDLVQRQREPVGHRELRES